MMVTWLKLALGPKEERWAQMIVLSFVFHCAIFFASLFISKGAIYYPTFDEHVYHVELVAPPSPRTGGGVKGGGVATRRGTPTIAKTSTRRIAVKKKPPVTVVAKRVSPKPLPQPKKKTTSASELINGAISRVEREVAQEGNRLEETISRIEKRLEIEKKTQPPEIAEKVQEGGEATTPRRTGGRMPLGSSGTGKGIQLYQIEIETAIKDNWSFPVALLNVRKDKTPEAVILLTVRSDGKIVKARFKKKSRDSLFNDSVLKAIERSDPLPKFPPGYKKSSDEVEIRFSLKDLVR
jgi:colicin import membrane protein